MTEILFFTSPIGLGHATRCAAISQHLGAVKRRFVTGAGAYMLLSRYGLDAMDLYHPPPFQVEDGRLRRPLRWLFSYLSFYRQSKKISSDLISGEKPRVVVSDEDFASLVSAQRRGIKNILVTDILETRFASGIGSVIEGLMNRGMRGIIEKCDLVLVPEEGASSGRIVRVGPIVRETGLTRDEIRRKYGFSRKTVLVAAGGTALGRFLIERTAEAFARTGLDAELVAVSGPVMKIEGGGYRNLGFVPDMHEVICAADLVVSLAGKSTIDESRHFGTPGIFIPIRGHFEQEENARELGFRFEDIGRLEELITKKIDERRDPRRFDGARVAAETISRFL
ncbi:MAG: UDP-glucuronosyltransferase [Thaumarchaeota archaeon]|nr:UDP-glucuronosyltransferase [Nitrososphaerota archaeon]